MIIDLYTAIAAEIEIAKVSFGRFSIELAAPEAIAAEIEGRFGDREHGRTTILAVPRRFGTVAGMFLSLAEVAGRLGLHPGSLRAMIAAGRVAAEKVGGGWLIDSAEVARLERSEISRGRPWSARSVWALLEAAAGGRPDGLSRSERQRLQDRLSQLAEIPPGRLAGRAVLYHLHGHPASLERLAEDHRVVIAGAAAVAGRSPDLVADDLVAVYVPADSSSEVVDEYRLRRVPPSAANLEMRVPVGAWPFDSRLAPWPVAAADLLDRADERAVRAARALFAAADAGSEQ